MSNSESDTIARVNSIRVTADDLIRVTGEVDQLPKELRDGDGLVHVTAQMFKGSPYKAFAVCERMYALADLLKSGSLPKSLVPTASDGGHIVSDDVFSAAAQEPLLFRGNRAYFHPESFLTALLNLANPNGQV